MREFHKKAITLQQLSNMLFIAFGKFHKDNAHEEDLSPFFRRTSPSGGCLQIMEQHILVYNVTDVISAVYAYDMDTHSLCYKSKRPDYSILSDCLAGQFFATDCACGIFLVANLEMLYWKYKTVRNYKIMFLEAGHFSQTLLLSASAENINTWITGAFSDERIEKLLQLDPNKKAAIFFIALGYGEYKSMHSFMKKQLDKYKSSDN